MDFQNFKKAVFDAAAEKGLTDYEFYYQTAESTSAGAFGHEIDSFSASVEGGVCFRCIVDGKMGYASTENLSDDQAKDLVNKAYENARILEAEEPVFLNAGGLSYAPLTIEPYPLPSAQELIDTVLDTQEKLYGADPSVIDGCSVRGVSEAMELAICNSKGLDLHYRNHAAGLIIGALIEEKGEKANHHKIKLSQLDTIHRDALVAEAVTGAKNKLGGDVAPTGVCPVIFDPEAMSSLLQVFASVFSAESAQKGLSRLAGLEDTVIASEAVTLMDDPFHKDNPMPIHFDAEGSPTYCKAVIEKGVLKTLLYNLKTANQAGKQTTGNAAKANYSASVGTRPFTMYLKGGDLTEEQLLEKAGNGVYINALSGLHAGANPISGDFSLQSAGYLIENGKKTIPVKSFTVAGNFYTLLKDIAAVADNACLPMALDTTAFGAPSTLVENLSIAGK